MQNKGVSDRLMFVARRSRLKLGTAIGGAMVLALLPGAGQAAALRNPYRISTPVLNDAIQRATVVPSATSDRTPPFRVGSPLLATVAEPQDLTIHPAAHGLLAPVPAAAGITVNQGDIMTTGDNMPGIAVSTPGGVTVSVGNVTTYGAYSPGVSVSAGGPVAISTGNVSTYGDTSPGISATSAADITINTGQVLTTGVNSTGIYAYSSGGKVSIDAGNVYAVGAASSFGISATGHDVSVTAGNVAGGNNGIYAHGVGAGATVDLTVNGNVQAQAGHANGIFATSDGSITISDANNISSASLLPLGRGNGIYAHGYGDVSIDAAGTIKAYGHVAGIAARSDSGAVTINSGRINIYGNHSVGIDAYAAGNVAVTAGDMYLGGNFDTGISASSTAGSVDVTFNGDMQVPGQTGAGIIATSYAGNVAIHNNGSIEIGSFADVGIRAVAEGDVVVDGSGSVTTGLVPGSATFSDWAGAGVFAYSHNGSVSVSQGSVASNDSGVAAIARPGYYGNDASHGISVDVGSIQTKGSGQFATGIVALDYNAGSTISINAGSLSTIGDYAGGIQALATAGTVDISGGSISTRGNHAEGITLIGSAYVNVDLQSITTTGSYHSSGIEVQTNPFAPASAVALNIGSVSTAGYVSPGIVVKSNGNVDITSNAITTGGAFSTGVYAESNGQLTISAGSVSTAGTNAMGVYAAGLSGVSLTTKSISTQGDGALGVLAKAGDDGTVALDLGNVSTKGNGAVGVVAVTGHGTIDLKADGITTTGGGAQGVVAYAFYGSANVNVGTASTSGIKAAAIFAEGGTDATVTAGTVSTQGDNSNGIIIRSGSYSVGGTGVVTVGSVTTAGNVTAAIDAIAIGDADHASNMTITANSITTTGQDAVGITATANYGTLDINAGSITTKGPESVGIIALGGGDIGVKLGSITSAATGIYTNESGTGTVSFDVSGKVASSAGDGIVAINSGGTTSITIGANGGVQAAGDAIAVQSGGGTVTITNAGTIAGGAGYAIDVSGVQNRDAGSDTVTVTGNPSTSITNSGTIVGTVRLAGGGNSFANSGTFVATRDSDFGAGSDAFTNTGTVRFAAAAVPTAVSFLGLEKFANNGLVDLRNGVAGDTLTVPGSYIGSGNASLGLDIGANGVTDKLVIGGAATGATTILLSGDVTQATLLAKPVTLVQAGAGTSATAFSLAGVDIGFIHYGLGFQAATDSFALTANAGAPVYRLAKTSEAAQAIWRQSADAWSSHMAELRDAGGAGNRLWGQIYGAVDTRHGSAGGYDVGYRQDYVGGQVGFDLSGKQADKGSGFVFGVTGGYLSSHVNFTAAADRVRFDTVNVGAYAGAHAGVLFANLLGQYDHYDINAGNPPLNWDDHFNGNGYGLRLEAGARFGGERFFAEPLASIAWQRADLDALQALGQTLDFDRANGLTGQFGGRVGGTADLKGGAKALFYARVAYVHEFDGKSGVTFASGGASERVSGTRPGDFGQGALGVTFLTSGRLSGFIEGDADIGASKGGGGRAGIRFRL